MRPNPCSLVQPRAMAESGKVPPWSMLAATTRPRWFYGLMLWSCPPGPGTLDPSYLGRQAALPGPDSSVMLSLAFTLFCAGQRASVRDSQPGHASRATVASRCDSRWLRAPPALLWSRSWPSACVFAVPFGCAVVCSAVLGEPPPACLAGWLVLEAGRCSARSVALVCGMTLLGCGRRQPWRPMWRRLRPVRA